MKKLLVVLLLLSASFTIAKNPDERFSYLAITGNYMPDNEYKYGFGISSQMFYSENIFAIMDFTFPGIFDYAPFIGISGAEAFSKNDMWYLGLCPYHYMNIFIDKVSGVGDGISLSGGYNMGEITLNLTANVLPYSKDANSLGYIHAKLSYYLGDSWGLAASFQEFRFEDNNQMGMTSLHIFTDVDALF